MIIVVKYSNSNNIVVPSTHPPSTLPSTSLPSPSLVPPLPLPPLPPPPPLPLPFCFASYSIVLLPTITIIYF